MLGHMLIPGRLHGRSHAHRSQTHVLVLHVFEVAELPVRPLGVGVTLEGPGQLLQGDPHVVHSVHGRAGEGQQGRSHWTRQRSTG